MSKLTTALTALLSYVTACALILMLLHVVAHAISRHFFNAPIYGTNEIVSFWYLPIIALLGIPAAQLKGEHIAVTLVIDRLGEASARILRTFGAALGFALSAGFAWFGLAKAIEYTASKATAGVTDIVTWPVYYLVPLVFAGLALLYLLAIGQLWHLVPGQAPAVTPDAELTELTDLGAPAAGAGHGSTEHPQRPEGGGGRA
ncbi:TRAP transporter small permease subunit [Brevibacterium sp. 5221]|uniref:TRAP transporter small permease subunit n=1 Tax=Brevibacterium rongguiense TaxID=2695267 RepID=A0A6N9H4U7_9MICO|nr:TRAP transporter small permease [Brevibacterium rongguiense]MYM19078.1 TRAP transporter small permease subunit [Brevibacterium rongguiense]